MADAQKEVPRDAQGHPFVDADTLRRVGVLMGRPLDEARVALLGRAVQRNIAQAQVVRDLVLDDTVEPPTLFLPLR